MYNGFFKLRNFLLDSKSGSAKGFCHMRASQFWQKPLVMLVALVYDALFKFAHPYQKLGFNEEDIRLLKKFIAFRAS